jgi:hypothetical protein
MYLWLIKRNDKPGYDDALGAVIATETERQVREVAGTANGDQHYSVWYLPTTTVDCIGKAAVGVGPGILMTEFS